MPRKPPKPTKVTDSSAALTVVPAAAAAAPAPASRLGEDGTARPAATAGSRRKQRRPNRVLSESESEPAFEGFGADALLSVKQELPSSFEKAASSTTSATSATSSLIAALKSKRTPKPKQDIPRVECGVCKEKVNERAFERHALSNHLGLARVSGNNQEFSKTEKLSAFGRVLRAGGKLTCPLCQKSLTSALGFYHHHTQCGKEIEPVKCTKCGWFLKPLSMRQHMRKHEKDERMEREGHSLPPKKRGRKQATAQDDDADYDPAKDTRNGVTPKKRGFTAPRVSPHPTTVSKWHRRLETDGQLRCEMPGCQQQTATVEEMMAHYPQCAGMPAKWKVFSCDQCKVRTDTEAEMLKHIEQAHSAVREVAGGRGRSPDPPTPARGRPGHRRRGAVTSDMAGELTYFTPVERQACAKEHMRKYWAQLPKSRVVTAARLQLSDWWRCRGEEYSCYSPPMKLSPAYKVQEIGDPDPYRSFERLDVFAFEELDNGVLCFCGGPVVACDWCPRPGEWSAEELQYLAVSCLPVVDRHLSPVQPSSLPSAVQIWSFTGDRRSARLEYAVCVDGGPVWDLLWCPIGPRTGRPPGRLGSLALACGDGRVRVFTIPEPQALPAGGDAAGPAFYIKRADLRLEVFGDTGRSPCCRIDWAKTEGNRSVAGVFGNGVVTIWNLTTTSPILRETDGPTEVLYPVQVIPAHRGHGTALSFSPSGERFLVSGGRDRTLQMWDREEPASLQRNTAKLRPMLTDISWPAATKKIINAYDHSLFTGSPSVMMSDASIPVQDVPFFTHGSKCTSVSVNCTVNGLACSSESGLVALAHWRNMLCHKQKAELRRLLLKLEAERMMPSRGGDGGGGGGGGSGSSEELLLGDSYTQVWESCGVTLWEAKLDGKSGAIQEGFDDHVSNTGSWVSNYPFVAVNKVSWNRNAGADAWLAVGMECGLLRVLEVPAGAFSAVRS